jgi:hypothetical protein
VSAPARSDIAISIGYAKRALAALSESNGSDEKFQKPSFQITSGSVRAPR